MVRKIFYKDPSDAMVKMAKPSSDEKERRISVGMDKFMGEYYFIDVEKLIPFKNQSRVMFDDKELESLASTIKEHGVRQPLSIIKSEAFPDKFEVISGERRLKAAKIAGLAKVPCLILDNKHSIEEIALVENVQRSDLHPLELARGLKKLIDQYEWGGQSEIERKIGIPQSRISEHLKILSLSEDIQTLALECKFDSLTNLLSLLKLENDDLRREAILGAKKNKLDASDFSVLRIFYKEGVMRVQKRSMGRLNEAQKIEIKEELETILLSLS